MLEVHNKIDLQPGFEPRIDRGPQGEPVAVWVSARTGAGLDLLRVAVAERLDATKINRIVDLAPAQGRLRAQVYELGAVLAELPLEEGGWRMELTLSAPRWTRLFAEHPAFLEIMASGEEAAPP